MVDRTLLISACLVVIAFLFFAGTALMVMQMQNQGLANPPDFLKMNSGNQINIPQGTNPGMSPGAADNLEGGPTKMHRRDGQERSNDRGPSQQEHNQKQGHSNDDSPAMMKCLEQNRPDSISPKQDHIQKEVSGMNCGPMEMFKGTADKVDFSGNEKPEKPSRVQKFQSDDVSPDISGQKQQWDVKAICLVLEKQ